MEIFQSKMPFMPTGWTVGRAVKYVGKLGLFVFVPGLHQMACRRWILGGLLLALYAFSSFVLSNRPLVYAPGFKFPFETWEFVLRSAVIYSWMLLLVDWNEFEFRSLSRWSVAPFGLVVLLGFLPLHDINLHRMLVVQHDFACPAFCRNDIVKWHAFKSRGKKYSPGDYVVIGAYWSSPEKVVHLYS